MCEFTINKRSENSCTRFLPLWGFMKVDLFSPSIRCCLCHEWAHVLPSKGHNRRNAARISSRWYKRYAPTMIPLQNSHTLVCVQRYVRVSIHTTAADSTRDSVHTPGVVPILSAASNVPRNRRKSEAKPPPRNLDQCIESTSRASRFI